MIERLALMRRRFADESGHVGILIALAIFVVVGMLSMTWNTANLSKEKMRLQNAADSAALGFCTWQARGMNAIQNINDEMYVALSMADRLLKIAVPCETTALACEPLGNIPLIGLAFKIAAQALHVIALLTGGMSAILANVVCRIVLRPLSFVYAYGSTALGWWGAEQLAAKNRADPLGNMSINLGSWGGSLGIYAVGVAFPAWDTVLLPVEQLSDEAEAAMKPPWRREDKDGVTAKLFTTTRYFYKSIHKFLGTGEGWQFKPWISPIPEVPEGEKPPETGRTPGPSIWIAHKYYTHVEVLPLDAWIKNFSGKPSRKMPLFAIAAAQCITGDIVEHSKKPVKQEKGKKPVVNQRTAGFGTGATAKLVPVATALSALSPTVGKVVGVGIYH